jgi:hypothetical protein
LLSKSPRKVENQSFILQVTYFWENEKEQDEFCHLEIYTYLWQRFPSFGINDLRSIRREIQSVSGGFKSLNASAKNRLKDDEARYG